VTLLMGVHHGIQDGGVDLSGQREHQDVVALGGSQGAIGDCVAGR
jgi:hypothetical protein